MIIPIRNSYSYRNYPLAPKATALSMTLGFATSFVGVIIHHGIGWGAAASAWAG